MTVRRFSPWDISNTSESSQQIAFMCWCNMATNFGIHAANDKHSYNVKGHVQQYYGETDQGCTPLHWVHAIPNGGKRDRRTASIMKAEGVTSGVADVAFPYQGTIYYLEFKKPDGSGVQSPAQVAFEKYCREQELCYYLVTDWKEAVNIIINILGVQTKCH